MSGTEMLGLQKYAPVGWRNSGRDWIWCLYRFFQVDKVQMKVRNVEKWRSSSTAVTEQDYKLMIKKKKMIFCESTVTNVRQKTLHVDTAKRSTVEICKKFGSVEMQVSK